MGWESTDLKVRALLDRHGGGAEREADAQWAEFEAELRKFVAAATDEPHNDVIECWLQTPTPRPVGGSQTLRLPFWEANLVSEQLGGSSLLTTWRPA